MGYAAAESGLKDGGDWLDQVLTYLRANRDYVADFVREKLPSIRTFDVEATYLAWLDCTEAGIEGNPARFFREKARVGLSDGEDFGKNYEKFVRLNFACPRKILQEALDRMVEGACDKFVGED